MNDCVYLLFRETFVICLRNDYIKFDMVLIFSIRWRLYNSKKVGNFDKKNDKITRYFGRYEMCMDQFTAHW